MSKRFRILPWYSLEGHSVFFHVVDTDGEELESLEFYASRTRAEADAARRNEAEEGEDHERSSDHLQAR